VLSAKGLDWGPEKRTKRERVGRSKGLMKKGHTEGSNSSGNGGSPAMDEKSLIATGLPNMAKKRRKSKKKTKASC